MEIIFTIEFLCWIIPIVIIIMAWYVFIAKELLNQEKRYGIVEVNLRPGIVITLNNDEQAVVISCMKFSIIIEDEQGVCRKIYKQQVKCINE
jgi:hypothetical protein